MTLPHPLQVTNIESDEAHVTVHLLTRQIRLRNNVQALLGDGSIRRAADLQIGDQILSYGFDQSTSTV